MLSLKQQRLFLCFCICGVGGYNKRMLASCQASARLCTLQSNMPPEISCWCHIADESLGGLGTHQSRVGGIKTPAPRQVTNRQEEDGNRHKVWYYGELNQYHCSKTEQMMKILLSSIQFIHPIEWVQSLRITFDVETHHLSECKQILPSVTFIYRGQLHTTGEVCIYVVVCFVPQTHHLYTHICFFSFP